MKVPFAKRVWIRLLGLGLGLLLSWVATGSLVNGPGAVAKEVSAVVAAQAPGEAKTEVKPEAKMEAAERLLLLPENRPVVVKVGLYVSNLAEINQGSETFDVAGYLFYTWRDGRLAYNAKQMGTNARTVKLEDIWHPAVEMVNFKESKASDTTVTIAPDGTVTAQERFSKTLSSGLDLRRFPFDREHLQVVIESLLYPLNDVRFTADKGKLAIGKDSFVSLSEWTIQGIQGLDGKSFFPPEQQDYSRVTMDVSIQRNSGFYLFKVMMPLFLITIASWGVFWIDAKEFSTQITIAFTNLLTVVALLLVVNDSLPRVGYLTFMDGFTMLCFAAILVVIVELIWVHRWESRDDHDQAQKIHVMARWIVPSGFLLTCAGLWGIMIGV
jgi:Neurotransmitter-gated ion-channel ligand binding domain/Neurotransmitter-gated ion-channel transmembrane region